MKPRATSPAPRLTDDALQPLVEALGTLSSNDERIAFLRDLCTPAELEALVDRWRVVPLLVEGVPYRDIHQRTGVSVTTTGRVARTLEQGHGGYALVLDRLPAL